MLTFQSARTIRIFIKLLYSYGKECEFCYIYVGFSRPVQTQNVRNGGFLEGECGIVSARTIQIVIKRAIYFYRKLIICFYKIIACHILPCWAQLQLVYDRLRLAYRKSKQLDNSIFIQHQPLCRTTWRNVPDTLHDFQFKNVHCSTGALLENRLYYGQIHTCEITHKRHGH